MSRGLILDNQILKLIGAPYKAGGRGPVYFDCWGLTMQAINILTGQTIPDYKLNPVKIYDNAFFVKVALKEGFWHAVTPDRIRPGLVVAFQLNAPGQITHAGVTISDKKLIQTTEKHGATINYISKYQNLIQGFYKYEKN